MKKGTPDVVRIFQDGCLRFEQCNGRDKKYIYIMHRIYFIFILLVFSINICTVYAEPYAIEKNTNNRPLWDIGHHYLPDTSKYRRINDIMSSSLFFSCIIFTNRRTEFVTTLSIALFIRLVMIYATILPSSTTNCKFSGYMVGGCHDKVFSGHITTAVLSTIFLTKRFPQHKIILLLLCLANSLSTISSRDHYTIDVMIAIVISTLLTTNKYYFI